MVYKEWRNVYDEEEHYNVMLYGIIVRWILIRRFFWQGFISSY